jgi:hypothetical protein
MDKAQLENLFEGTNDSVAILTAASQFMERVAKNQDPEVRPGQTERFTEGCVAGDYCRQGDMYIILSEKKVPKGYIKVTDKSQANLQLVPGNTKGAKHCLDSWDGVEMYRKKDWGPDSLDGPFLVLTKDRTVGHDEHGTICLLAGQSYDIGYQRERDMLAAMERRRLD